jgi:outer membrane protein assembly factor BamB
MFRNLRLLPVTILLSAATSVVHAQTDPIWSVAPGGSVSWVRSTSAGNLLACTSEGLKGIDASSGNVIWTVARLANAPEDQFKELEGSPFVALASADGKDPVVVVEPFTGAVLFSAADGGLTKVVRHWFLYDQGVIMVTGLNAAQQRTTLCVDMATGNIRWTKEGELGRITGCASDGKDGILISSMFFCYNLDAKTGKEVWKRSADPSAEKMGALMGLLESGAINLGQDDAEMEAHLITTDKAPGRVIMVVQRTDRTQSTDSKGNPTTQVSHATYITAFNNADGSYPWSEVQQYNFQLGTVVPLDKGLLVGAGNNRSVVLVDYATGQGLWGKKGKGINANGGSLNGAVAMGDKVLLTAGGSKAVAMLHDAQGEELWKKAVKLKGEIRSVKLLDNAVAIASAEEIDVVDRGTGESLIGGSVKGGGDLSAMDDQALYFFNGKDGLVYRMPSSGGAAQAITQAALVFEGKEQPARLELLPEGVLLTSDQNLALFDMQGGKVHQSYFPAPRESGLRKALLYASAVRAAYYTASFGYASAAFGAAAQSIEVQDANSAMGKELAGGISNMYGQAASAGMDATKNFVQQASSRFKATQETSGMQYILTQKGKQEHSLEAVNKADGKVVGSVPLGEDKQPVYTVDAIEDVVYLVKDGAISAYPMR